MDTVETKTVIGIFTLCFLPDCFLFLQSSQSHTSLFQEYFLHFPFAGVAVLREACMSAAMSAARVQVNQYQWPNTNTHTQTHHTHRAVISARFRAHVQACLCIQHMKIYYMYNNIFTHGLPNKHSHTHLGSWRGHLCLCMFPLLSTWLCCAPHCAHSTPAIWNQTPMDQHPAGVIHCWCWGHSTWHTAMRSLQCAYFPLFIW